jgi:hypothetical protein
VLAVIVDVLASPFTVRVPELAVIDPRCPIVMYMVGAVIVDILEIPRIVRTPVLAVTDP